MRLLDVAAVPVRPTQARGPHEIRGEGAEALGIDLRWSLTHRLSVSSTTVRDEFRAEVVRLLLLDNLDLFVWCS